jgi:hypothetical protein
MFLAVLLLARGLAQAPASVTVHVSESGGMRRTLPVARECRCRARR